MLPVPRVLLTTITTAFLLATMVTAAEPVLVADINIKGFITGSTSTSLLFASWPGDRSQPVHAASRCVFDTSPLLLRIILDAQ